MRLICHWKVNESVLAVFIFTTFLCFRLKTGCMYTSQLTYTDFNSGLSKCVVDTIESNNSFKFKP